MKRVTPQRILVIEDDLDIANVLRLDLTDAGFEIEHADTAMTGLIRAREEHPDLILLDLGLPDFDGGDVVQRLRKNSTVPVIVLTARDTVEERVRLLGLGADDYVIKPFHPDELLARIKVQLRQRGSESLTLGDLELDPQKRLVRYKAEELRLSPKEFDILALLIRQPGRVYSRQEIGQDIWQGRSAGRQQRGGRAHGQPAGQTARLGRLRPAAHGARGRLRPARLAARATL